ncbi:MAG: fasciclin domain-containing protein [Prolixibacteraceae bacterium]|nr:fasciclin domain-containing protein [Prolixibacteraceae bacterium]
MRKLELKLLSNLKKLSLAGILALAVFAVSCEKEDDVLLPTTIEESELKSGKAVKKGAMTIAEIVVAANNAEEPQFTLLLAALEYAGLTDVFAGTDQYTVFAPTDQAFIDLVVALGVDPNDPFTAIDAALGEGTVANVLLYHVTDGRRAANSVLPKKDGQMKEITTLLGQTFDVDNYGMIYTASDGMSSIVTDTPGATFNISASNGVIHVISAVMLPEL